MKGLILVMNLKGFNKKNRICLSIGLFVFIFLFSTILFGDLDSRSGLLTTNATVSLSNKKICWGIKRAKDHKQPDVGASNKSLIDQYNGICLGNANHKFVYLTFDSRI